MKYISAKQFAEKYGISERTARNYCAVNKIQGAFLTGKTWIIPEDAILPLRKNARIPCRSSLLCEETMTLLSILREQKTMRLPNGIYHKTQIDFTYNTNHIEGSKLSHDQTRYIFETNTIGIADIAVNVDDIIETVNHFRCMDFILDTAEEELSEQYIKQLHLKLKTSTSDSRKEWFAVGDYKRVPNEVGGNVTASPEQVHKKMQTLIARYNSKRHKALRDIIDFHCKIESIHPFQDGNGRVGRLIMFKECLANNIVPFIITDRLKLFYYRGLKEWGRANGYLTDTILTAQDTYKKALDYFQIKYE